MAFSFNFFRNHRGDISLSMNMLVVIIISLVLLGMGIYFLYQLMGIAEGQKEALDARTKEEILHLLLDEGKKVALPLHIADIQAGESHIFGVGIYNTEQDNDQFRLEITLDKAVDYEGNDFKSQVTDINDWLLYPTDVINLPQNDYRTEPIMVEVPGDAHKGKYLFNVEVLRGDNNEPYYHTLKFVVNVR
ncbi:hypothetical protein HYU21_03055 [Candidatus Woesearchaeota archaeon]|nr:hypothetical protein [Candidatus Woesearchaeota archaeon]